ncbi:hypothetical protein JCM9279_006820 [Rhodotorula babjevae]
MDTIRLTGSYILAPARLAHSAVWYALGYSTLDSSASAPASARRDDGEPEQLHERAPAQSSSCSEVEDGDERVVRALRAAMREWDEASSAAGSDGEERDEEQDDPAWREPQLDSSPQNLEEPLFVLAPADVPLPDSPSSSSSFDDADDLAPIRPPSLPRPASPPALEPLARPLSSLSRLSRRAALCLSRLVDLDDLDFVTETSRPAHEEDGEPSEREKELVERVMAVEVERVTEEVGGMVDAALRGEEDERGAGQGGEQAGGAEVPLAGRGEGEAREPEAATWFTTEAGRSFELVDVGTGAIETDAFLRAAESLVSMSELLAPAAASLCAGEYLADIGRVRARRHLFPARTTTLEQLVQSERRERRRPATDALEWLVRLIGFMAESFRLNLSSEPPEELSASISTVWDRGFATHFNWLVRPLFKVILRACPSRMQIYSKLALSPSTTTADVERDLGAWLDQVEKVVTRVREVLKREGRRR